MRRAKLQKEYICVSNEPGRQNVVAESQSSSPSISPATPESGPKATRISTERHPAFTAGESPDIYVALKNEILALLKPQDAIERMYVSDILNSEWELRRLQQLSADIYVAARPFAVCKLLGYRDDNLSESPVPMGNYEQAQNRLQADGLGKRHLNALVAVMHSSSLESIDKRSLVLETRRDQALAKLEKRRADAKTIDHA